MNIGFINNCDTKISIGLAVNGVFISEIIGCMWDETLGFTSIVQLLVSLSLLILGASFFIYMLWARHEKGSAGEMLTSVWENEEYCQEMNTTFLEAVDSICEQRIKRELVEQIRINAKLVRRKYRWYNVELTFTVLGSLWFIVFSVLQHQIW